MASADRGVGGTSCWSLPGLKPLSGLGPPALANRLILGRRRLRDALAATDAPVIALVAPAGYGKTFAVVDQLRCQPSVPAAWLSVDRYDDGPTTFWRNIAAAIGVAMPAVATTAADIAGNSRASSPMLREQLSRLLGSSEIVEHGLVIVLDDLDAVASEILWTELEELIERMPDHVRLIITARTAGGLPLERWRGEHRAAVYGVDELRFRDDEAAALLAMHGAATDQAGVRRALYRCEGWAVGLVLHSLAGTGDDRVMPAGTSTIDYLLSEVLAGLDDDDADLLTALSVLEDFDAELCREVFGGNDSVARFATLVLSSGFVVPLPNGRFRFHQLVREALAAMLRRLRGHDYVAGLHRAAAAAFARRGETGRHVGHLLQAGDPDSAFEVLVSNALEIGQAMWALEWLDEWPTGFVIRDIDRMLDYAAVMSNCCRLDRAHSWLDRARAVAAPTDGHRNMRIDVQRAMLFAAAGRLGEARALGEAVHGSGLEETRRDRMLASLAPTMARVCVVQGDLDAAARWAEVMDVTSTWSPVLLEAARPAVLSLIQVRRGKLHDADRLACAALEASRTLGNPFPATLDALLTIHEVQLEQGRLTEATRTIEAATAAAEEFPYPSYEALYALRYAAHVTAIEGPAAGLRALDSSRSAYRIDDLDPDFGWSFDVAGARYLLLAGRDEEAAQRWARLPVGPARSLVEARASLRHDLPRVLELTADVSTWSDGQRIEGFLLRARATGDRRSIDEALELAGPELRVRPFVQEGRSIIRAVVATARRDERARRLLPGLERFDRHRSRPNSLAEGAALTAREHAVLRLLASDRTGGEIAAAMKVSYNTLKTHRRSLFAKLGVASRREAVRRGRTIGLL